MEQVEQQWFFTSKGQKVGPLTKTELVSELASPAGRDALVWRHGLPEWVRAETLAELSLGPPPIPTPPPVPAPNGAGAISAWKVIAWVIATPVLLFAGFTILLAVSEAFSETETYASSVGMSERECRDVRMKLGDQHDRAAAACAARQPKKR